jgi:hypothetical protein
VSIRVEETINSRALRDDGVANQRSIEVEFVAWDDDHTVSLSPVDVRAAVLVVLLAAPYGDPLYGLHLNEIVLADQLAPNIQMARAIYGVQEPAQVDLLKWGFSTAGGTVHVATIASYAATGAGTPPDCHQAVNVGHKDRNIGGYDRNVPQLSFWVETHFDPTDWNATTLLTLNSISWTYNLSSWHGWPAKYVMFTHCEAPQVTLGAATAGSPKLVPVKFYFQARPPETVDKLNGIAFTKSPWDHVWDASIDYPDTAAKALGKKILYTYREQIYYGSDFTLLGLGS